VSIVAALALLAPTACRDRKAIGPPATDVALEGFSRERPIPIVLETTEGPIHCELDPTRTPKTVAMFVGFATGRAEWLDPRTKEVAHRPLYADLAVFRAIPDAMFQTGCPIGDATGTPGYRVPVEASGDDGRRLASPGALFFARYNPPPNRTDPNPPPPGDVIGSQFVVSVTDMHHLAGNVTVVGSCTDLETANRITHLVAKHEKDVRLVRVAVGR
jgi:peptidyl-prolyl cis-trans isomerase A (cyclophilin A)